MKVSEMLNECIEQMRNMTQEEFNSIKTARGIIDEQYNESKYVGGGFNIILPKDIKRVMGYEWAIGEQHISSSFFNKTSFCWESINYIDICTNKNGVNINNYMENIVKNEKEVIEDLNNNNKNDMYEEDFSKAA